MKLSAAVTTAATPLLVIILALNITCHINSVEANDGKYNKRKYGNGNHGQYRHTQPGDYVEDVDRYRYVHYDDGDRGRYVHVHIPYDGGYGNYEGGHEPFRNPPYDASGLYAYVSRPKNESCLRLLEQYSNTCSDSSADSPFKTAEYDIRKPTGVYQEYGTPYPELNYGASSQQVKNSSTKGGGVTATTIAESDPRASKFPGLGYLPVPKPSLEYGIPPPLEHRVSEPTKQILGYLPVPKTSSEYGIPPPLEQRVSESAKQIQVVPFKSSAMQANVISILQAAKQDTTTTAPFQQAARQSQIPLESVTQQIQVTPFESATRQNHVISSKPTVRQDDVVLFQSASKQINVFPFQSAAKQNNPVLFQSTASSSTNFVTRAPETRNKITLAEHKPFTTESPSTTHSTTTAAKTTTAMKVLPIEQQLHQCHIALNTARLKLSHYEASGRE